MNIRKTPLLNDVPFPIVANFCLLVMEVAGIRALKSLLITVYFLCSYTIASGFALPIL
jgi:hypothetical protein